MEIEELQEYCEELAKDLAYTKQRITKLESENHDLLKLVSAARGELCSLKINIGAYLAGSGSALEQYSEVKK